MSNQWQLPFVPNASVILPKVSRIALVKIIKSAFFYNKTDERKEIKKEQI
jgi:hypothetical protein